ncbi:MAG: sialate O-acetylesterase [Bryobacteraceae bacterium]|nr:sialate O-acetylesterase [Bryobacteraceae bacterium]
MRTKIALSAILALSICHADVKLPALIGDHMLLQRDMPVRVFGKASPGEAVTVEFRGQSAATKADALGRWEAWLQPMKPAPAAEMTIRGNNTLKVADVLVGDVWVGSGQSNMQWSVGQTNNADAELAASASSEIRLFYVPRKPSPVPVDDVEAKWVVATPETVKGFSAVLYYFGRDLNKELKVPMGLIHSSWGGTPIASWISGPTLTSNARLAPFLTFWSDQIANFPVANTRYEMALEKWNATKTGPRPAAPMGPGNPHEPVNLYNGMIAPLVKYTIKGALWYQGESEAGRGQGHIYGEAMKTLVEDWRKAWGQGDFPYFWVQLANFGNASKNGHWMRVQEGQAQATSLKRTGMAVINDIGEDKDIHPKNKQDVGKRLVLLARHVAYGQTGFVYSSPMYRQTTKEASALRVWFDSAAGLTTRGGGPLKGFVVAGADRKWVPADAKIDGTTVVVSSTSVPDPMWVRYAWENNPVDANLVNSAGLPASLFRSDSRDEIVIQ